MGHPMLPEEDTVKISFHEDGALRLQHRVFGLGQPEERTALLVQGRVRAVEIFRLLPGKAATPEPHHPTPAAPHGKQEPPAKTKQHPAPPAPPPPPPAVLNGKQEPLAKPIHEPSPASHNQPRALQEPRVGARLFCGLHPPIPPRPPDRKS